MYYRACADIDSVSKKLNSIITESLKDRITGGSSASARIFGITDILIDYSNQKQMNNWRKKIKVIRMKNKIENKLLYILRIKLF